jgi:hypothetical protein
VSGRVRTIAELPLLYFTDTTGIYTAGRLLGVAAGTATIGAVFRLARAVSGPEVAAAAAVFTAVAPLHVRDSHYVKHDVPATFLVVCAYLAMMRVLSDRDEGRPIERSIWIAAAACGVAFSTHYYCVFLAVPLVAVIVASARGRGTAAGVRLCVHAGAIAGLIFLLLSPFIAIEPLTAWRDVTANRAIVVDRAVAEGAFAPLVRYAGMLLRDTTGMPVVLLAAAGIVGMLREHRLRALVLLSFPAAFLLFITNTFPASRYLNPVVPFLAVFGAYGAWWAARTVARRALVFWAIVLAAAAPAIYQSVRTDLFFRQTDTRTIALEWIHRRVPAGSGIALQPYSAPLEPTREALESALERNLSSSATWPPKFRLQLSRDPWPTPAYDVVYLGRGLDAEKTYVDYSELGGETGLRALRRLGVAYVVVKRYNRSDPETLPLLAALAREGRRLAVISPYRPGTPDEEAASIDPFLHNTDARIDAALERPGPALEIWQIDGPGS